VARAAPDGYTLMVGSVGMATNPLMFKELPYKATDLTPLALVGLAPNVLYVNATLPVKSIKELVEYAKKNPGKVTYASTGFGSSPHLAGELFASSAGVQLLHVPYKGTSAALADFLGGQVNIFFDTMQSMRYVQEGKIRVLGVTTEKRLAEAPELPTIEESGVASGVISSSWFGYFIQTAVPEARRKQIADALLNVANEKETQEKLKSFGLIPVALGPVEYQKFMDAETKRWGEVIKAQNIKVD
jgi:tripartite-type tricarboxylate transporter receptor subunit TctC